MGFHTWTTALLVFLILTSRPVSTAGDVPEWFVTYPSRALADIMATRHVPSPTACCAECTGTSDCVSAEFLASTGTCRLSDRDPVHMYPSGMTSATGSSVFVRGYIATATCGSGWVQRGMFCYTYLASAVDFFTAKQHCLDQGSHLAYIHSSEENAFITDTVAGGQEFTSFWIGVEDVRVSSDVWTNGQSVTFTHYGPEEPNFLEGDAMYCLEIMNAAGEWNDVPCSNSAPGVCKKHLYL